MMYENLGLITPGRTPTNRRRFSQRDVIKLRNIQKLTRTHGVNLAGARHILKLLKILQQAGVAPPTSLADIDVTDINIQALNRQPPSLLAAASSSPYWQRASMPQV